MAVCRSSSRGAKPPVKPAPFEYHAPQHVEGVLELIADEEREMRVLAGGQSLVPMMNFRLARPDGLVDLRRVEALRYVRREDGGRLAVGAGARQSDALRDPAVAQGWPLIAAALREIAHPQVRNRGTVCGSLAHHDPAAELPAVSVALDARMTVRSVQGNRELAAEEFFVSYFETALGPGELLAEVWFPALPAGTGWSFREVARRRGDFALVGVATLVRRESGVAASPRIVVFGAGKRPVRCRSAEAALDGRAPEEEVRREVADRVAEEIDPVDDVHASGEYRRDAAAALVERAIGEAWERCA
jgi:aerobic carbon-monoxide dehydrogenase medium subunit